MSYLKYTPKAYNENFYPIYSKARSFLNCLNDAVEYSGTEAQKQVKIIGWSEEVKQFLFAALECYDREVRNNINF